MLKFQCATDPIRNYNKTASTLSNNVPTVLKKKHDQLKNEHCWKDPYICIECLDTQLIITSLGLGNGAITEVGPGRQENFTRFGVDGAHACLFLVLLSCGIK